MMLSSPGRKSSTGNSGNGGSFPTLEGREAFYACALPAEETRRAAPRLALAFFGGHFVNALAVSACPQSFVQLLARKLFTPVLSRFLAAFCGHGSMLPAAATTQSISCENEPADRTKTCKGHNACRLRHNVQKRFRLSIGPQLPRDLSLPNGLKRRFAEVP